MGAGQNVQYLVEQACIYLTFELDVEVVKFAKYNELCEYLSSMTRVIENSRQQSGLSGEHVMK